MIPLVAALERSDHLRVAAQLERGARMSLDERQARQLRSLQELVEHAWKTVPYYREHFRACGFEPGDLRSFADLAGLPTLGKPDVRQHPERLVSEASDPRGRTRCTTTGSTGMPLWLYLGTEGMQMRRAVRLQRDRWTGWRDGERRAVVRHGGARPRGWRDKLRNALVLRISFLDNLDQSHERMAAFAGVIHRERPTLLFGHAHSLFLLAQFWEARSLPPYRFRAVLSTGMLLPRHERETLGRVFGAEVFDRYGCEEVGLLATECEAHAGLHLTADSTLLEIVPDPVDPPAGRVVVTELRNRAMPFIRYELGDRAILAPGACRCGRTYPLVRAVRGRVTDDLWTPLGAAVSGVSITDQFSDLHPDVLQGQIVQDRLDHVRMRIVPGAGFEDTTRARIARLVRDRFGPEMQHDIELVDSIPQDATGKYRFTICALPESARRRAANSAPERA